MAEPGYYEINYRALSIRELIRINGSLRLPLTFLTTRLFMKPGGGDWMPSLSVDTRCAKEDLSARFWETTAPQRQEFERLGFTPCSHDKLTRHVNPLYRDNGSIAYLHSRRSTFGFIMYSKVRTPAPAHRDMEQITMAFTAVFSSGSLSCTNGEVFFDPLPGNQTVFIKSQDAAVIHTRLDDLLQQRGEPPVEFPNWEAVRSWSDANAVALFEHRVRRGLYVRMPEDEVQRRLPPPLPKISF